MEIDGTSWSLSQDAMSQPREARPSDKFPQTTQDPLSRQQGNQGSCKSCWLCFVNLANDFPRVTTIVLRIALPLFFLIFISTCLGHALSRLEAPGEFDENDQKMATLFVLEALPIDQAVSILGALPALCFQNWIQLRSDGANETLPYRLEMGEVRKVQLEWERNRAGFRDLLASWNVEDEVVRDVQEKMDRSFRGFNDLLSFESFSEIESDLEGVEIFVDDVIENGIDFMRDCGDRAEEVIRQLVDLTEILAKLVAAEDLTFNWIRCWNASDTGSFFVWSPTSEMLEAVKVQDEFYDKVWRLDQERLYEEYIAQVSSMNGNPGNQLNASEEALAREQSIRDASGRSGCNENTSASAWFWFTIMTTVGYGNQAPVTSEGRWLTIVMGFLSILAFGGVLATAGAVVKVLFDDFVDQTPASSAFFHRHSVGTTIWGGIAISWMYVLGVKAAVWWNNRLELEATDEDKFWFGFITSTTVGLGDYFLPPEAMFLRDVVVFSTIYLTGFVFVAAFLSNLEAWISSVFPLVAAGDKLQQRLRRTRLLRMGTMDDIEELGNCGASNMDASEKASDPSTRSKGTATILAMEKLLALRNEQPRENGEGSAAVEASVAISLDQLQQEEELVSKLLEQIIEEKVERLEAAEHGPLGDNLHLSDTFVHQNDGIEAFARRDLHGLQRYESGFNDSIQN